MADMQKIGFPFASLTDDQTREAFRQEVGGRSATGTVSHFPCVESPLSKRYVLLLYTRFTRFVEYRYDTTVLTLMILLKL